MQIQGSCSGDHDARNPKSVGLPFVPMSVAGGRPGSLIRDHCAAASMPNTQSGKAGHEVRDSIPAGTKKKIQEVFCLISIKLMQRVRI